MGSGQGCIDFVTRNFLKFDVQLCRFWCILTVIESLVLADDPTRDSEMTDSGGIDPIHCLLI